MITYTDRLPALMITYTDWLLALIITYTDRLPALPVVVRAELVPREAGADHPAEVDCTALLADTLSARVDSLGQASGRTCKLG